MIVMFVVINLSALDAFACPNCRDAIQDTTREMSSGGSVGSLSKGFYLGIVGMLAVTIMLATAMIRLMIKVANESTIMPDQIQVSSNSPLSV